jgi:hypothetical protein
MRGEALVKYMLRPPIAQERLRSLDDGLVRLELRRRFCDAGGVGSASTQATRSSASPTRCRINRWGSPSTSSGTATFSNTLQFWTSLKS